jgi:xylulokinase
MARELLLGIDVGTQSTRVALLDLEGRVVASASGSYDLVTTRPGWAEQDPETWWDVTVQGIRAVLAQAAVQPGELLAVGTDAQMHATVPLDAHGNLLSHSVQLWCDKRAAALVEEHTRRHDLQAAMRLAANPPLPAWIGFKMLWLKTCAPELYDRAATFVAGQGFINHRLTGQAAMDWSEASGSFLLDARTLAWSPELAEQVGVDLGKLPPVLPSTAVVGTITPEAARQTGLLAGTPVVAGAGDMMAMLVAAGLAQSGRALDISGTASDFCVFTERPVTDRPFMNLHHAMPGWIPFGIAEAGGGSLKWFKDRLCAAERLQATAEGREVYDVLDAAASAVEPGSEGLLFLPYLMGERVLGSPFSRGVFFGITHRTDIGAMMRSIMEGVCFDLRRTLEIVEAAGTRVAEVYTTGGGARSALWSQIKADVYDRPVYTLQASEGGVLGSAIMAGVGVGVYADIAAGAARCVHVDRRFEPIAAHRARYAALYDLFLDIHDRLQEPFARLSSLP